jgi:hypothetical protein
MMILRSMCSLAVNTAVGIGGILAVWRHAISVIVVFYISNEMLDIKYDFSCKRLRLCSSKIDLLRPFGIPLDGFG